CRDGSPNRVLKSAIPATDEVWLVKFRNQNPLTGDLLSFSL
ncbi:MAG: hypothetical protein ACI92C_002439, partial [Neolewinella sp.]